jgi:hypothetical protein
MSFALKYGSNETPDKPSGLIYFDAISAYTQEYRGQVTKHPISDGGVITDHFIAENPVFTLTGIISGVDISTFTNLIRDLENNIPFNVYPATPAVSINSGDSPLFGLVPDVIGQFFRPIQADIIIDQTRTDLTPQVREMLISLMKGIVYDEQTRRFKSNVEVISLYEYEGILLKKIHNNLVATNIRFREDAATGDAIHFDITLEQVTFVTLRREALPKDVSNALKAKATTEQKKGKQDSSVGDVEADAEDDNKKSPKQTSVLKQYGDEIIGTFSKSSAGG